MNNSPYMQTDTITVVENVLELIHNFKWGSIGFAGSGVVLVMFDLDTVWAWLMQVYHVDLVEVVSLFLVLLGGLLIQFRKVYKDGVRGWRLIETAFLSFMTRATLYAGWVFFGVVIGAVIRTESPSVAGFWILGCVLCVLIVEAVISLRSLGVDVRRWFGVGKAAVVAVRTGETEELLEGIERLESTLPQTGDDKSRSSPTTGEEPSGD